MHPLPDRANRYVLLIRCKDVAGIVASVSGFLAGNGFFIHESAQYGEESTGLFFMRVEFSSVQKAERQDALPNLRSLFAGTAEPYGMDWRIEDLGRRQNCLLLVSKEAHCLHDLLHRTEAGALPADVKGVVSNHPDLEYVARRHGVPFLHLPVSDANRREQEQAILDCAEREGAGLIVLAKYMQILSPWLVSRLGLRAINIHHSFLPSFKGSRPYHQAYEKGVKIIGATAHYVSNDLDEGPIIHQEVKRIDRPRSVEDMIAVGRDIEALVLSYAVMYHLQYRVIVHNNRTVVFT
jgi:formyltetrahydrofolate deformylase